MDTYNNKRELEIRKASLPSLFWSPNSYGVQIWFSLKNQKLGAHLQDGEVEYVGWSNSYEGAVRKLRKKVGKRYEHTVNYMRLFTQ